MDKQAEVISGSGHRILLWAIYTLGVKFRSTSPLTSTEVIWNSRPSVLFVFCVITL